MTFRAPSIETTCTNQTNMSLLDDALPDEYVWKAPPEGALEA